MKKLRENGEPVGKPFIVILINHSVKWHTWQKLFMHTSIQRKLTQLRATSKAHMKISNWNIYYEYHVLKRTKHIIETRFTRKMTNGNSMNTYCKLTRLKLTFVQFEGKKFCIASDMSTDHQTDWEINIHQMPPGKEQRTQNHMSDRAAFILG